MYDWHAKNAQYIICPPLAQDLCQHLPAVVSSVSFQKMVLTAEAGDLQFRAQPHSAFSLFTYSDRFHYSSLVSDEVQGPLV